MDDAISKTFNLDEIDKNIITLLQNQPNITHSKIAKEIGRSQPAVGSRIHRLEERGIVSAQFGINFKSVSQSIHLVKVELETKKPEELYKMSRSCPFIINCMKLSGKNNIMIFLASSSLKKIDAVVDYHFRNKSYVSYVSMDLITDFVKDFILPIDFQIDEHDPDKESGCGELCKVFTLET
jgi:DNA-binding Lrp family transcriptional regulator